MASIEWARRCRRSCEWRFHFTANPNNSCPHYVQNISALQRNRLPVAGELRHTGYFEAARDSPQVSYTQAGVFRHYEAGASRRIAAQRGIRIEQYQIARTIFSGKSEIGCQIGHYRIGEAVRQADR